MIDTTTADALAAEIVDDAVADLGPTQAGADEAIRRLDAVLAALEEPTS